MDSSRPRANIRFTRCCRSFFYISEISFSTLALSVFSGESFDIFIHPSFRDSWADSHKLFPVYKVVLKDLAMVRSQPNIIITGTPGVGKTSHCELLAQATGLRHLSINHLVKERDCHDGYNEEFQSWVVDEDKVRPCKTENWITDERCLSCWMRSRTK